MIDARDEALQRACPILAAPLFGALPAMENGQRVIVASDGVFLQVKRDWLDCVERLGDIDAAMPLPYGKMTPSLRFTFGTIPIALLDAFIAAGRARLPNEIAGGLIYSAKTQTLWLAVYESVHSTAQGIDYRMPSLAYDESIAVDLHTHALLPAFWSATDNADDRSIKVAGVFGNLDRDQPSAAFRLVLNGMYRTLAHPREPAAAQPVESDGYWPTLESLGLNAGESWII
jgi:PRTRC genetic system protein A